MGAIDAIVAHLEIAKWDQHIIFGVRLALVEAVVNAMKHGNQFDPAKKVKIHSMLGDDKQLTVEISDEGSGFDPNDLPDPTDVENLDRPCGRGLLLMKHYMNKVEVLDRGNVVRLTKMVERQLMDIVEKTT